MSNWPINYEGGAIDQVTAVTYASSVAGVTITAGSPAHNKGAYTELIASTANAYDELIIDLLNTTAPATSFFIDIAIGAASSEKILIENIFHTARRSGQVQGSTINVPIHVPAGVRLSARCQALTASSIINIGLKGVRNKFGGLVGSSGVETIGANLAGSVGTVVDAGLVANTKGGYVEFSAATANSWRGFILHTNDKNNTALTDASFLVDVAVGAGGSEKIIVPDINVTAGATLDLVNPNLHYFPIPVAKSSRVALQCQSTTTVANDRALGCVIHGIVA